VLLAFRLYMLNGQLPVFSRQDNPAAFEPSSLHRGLTYSYLAACNLVFLLYPRSLSYDWQMHSITPIRSLLDARNSLSLLVLTALLYSLAIIGRLFVRTVRASNLVGSTSEKPSQLIVARIVFGWLFTVLPYLPASNLFVTVGFVLAERTLYMSR
jgi:hypothetical protein